MCCFSRYLATQTLGLEHRVSPRTEEEERTCLASETGLETTLLGSEESNTTGIRAELLEPGCCVPTCLLYRRSGTDGSSAKAPSAWDPRRTICLSVCLCGREPCKASCPQRDAHKAQRGQTQGSRLLRRGHPVVWLGPWQGWGLGWKVT